MDPEQTLHLLETETDAHEAIHTLHMLVEWVNSGGYKPYDTVGRLQDVAKQAKQASMSLTRPSRDIQDFRELAYRIDAYIDTLNAHMC